MLDPRSEQLNLAGTHLNLTAILTKLGKHNVAINHAKSSIIILRRLIDRKELALTKQSVAISEPGVQESAVKVQEDSETQTLNNYLSSQESKNLYMTEAIAYYNLGASYEHLGGSKLQ
jgi:hypothetical protein